MATAHEETYKGLQIKIGYDEGNGSPRKEFDNLGKLNILGGRNHMGVDESDLFTSYFKVWDKEYREWDELKFVDLTQAEQMKELDKMFAVWLPVYRYEHSGVAYNTGGFNCPWDSGQVGYIGITWADARKEYSKKRISKQLREKMAEYLKGEVSTYSAWANGEIYYYLVTDDENVTTHESVHESCGGYYGELEYCISEAKSTIDHLIESQPQKELQFA